MGGLLLLVSADSLTGWESLVNQAPTLFIVGIVVAAVIRYVNRAETERRADLTRIGKEHEERMRELVDQYRADAEINRTMMDRTLTQLARSAVILEHVAHLDPNGN